MCVFHSPLQRFFDRSWLTTVRILLVGIWLSVAAPSMRYLTDGLGDALVTLAMIGSAMTPRPRWRTTHKDRSIRPPWRAPSRTTSPSRRS